VKEWQKVGYYRQGVVYALGNERKVVIPNCPVIHLKLDTKEVWWYRNTNRSKTIGSSKDI